MFLIPCVNVMHDNNLKQTNWKRKYKNKLKKDIIIYLVKLLSVAESDDPLLRKHSNITPAQQMPRRTPNTTNLVCSSITSLPWKVKYTNMFPNKRLKIKILSLSKYTDFIKQIYMYI